MRPSMRAAVVTLIAGFLLVPAQVQAAPRAPMPVAVGFDLVILRPLRLVSLVLGAGFLVPAAVITSPNGEDGFEAAAEVFIEEPADSLFKRRLGDF